MEFLNVLSETMKFSDFCKSNFIGKFIISGSSKNLKFFEIFGSTRLGTWKSTLFHWFLSFYHFVFRTRGKDKTIADRNTDKVVARTRADAVEASQLRPGWVAPTGSHQKRFGEKSMPSSTHPDTKQLQLISNLLLRRYMLGRRYQLQTWRLLMKWCIPQILLMMMILLLMMIQTLRLMLLQRHLFTLVEHSREDLVTDKCLRSMLITS